MSRGELVAARRGVKVSCKNSVLACPTLAEGPIVLIGENSRLTNPESGRTEGQGVRPSIAQLNPEHYLSEKRNPGALVGATGAENDAPTHRLTRTKSAGTLASFLVRNPHSHSAERLHALRAVLP